MAEQAGVPGNPTPQAGQDTLDKNGVPWKNRAKEAERKTEKFREKVSTLEARLAALESRVPTPQPNSTAASQPAVDPKALEAEAKRLREIQELAMNPTGFVRTEMLKAAIETQAGQAQNWIRSQEDYKPEIEPELARVIAEHGLNSLPLTRAQDAWELLKREKPHLFPKSIRVDSRDKDLARYQVLGPGRQIAEEPSDTRKKLLENLGKAGNVIEQADALAALTHDQFSRGKK